MAAPWPCRSQEDRRRCAIAPLPQSNERLSPSPAVAVGGAGNNNDNHWESFFFFFATMMELQAQEFRARDHQMVERG